MVSHLKKSPILGESTVELKVKVHCYICSVPIKVTQSTNNVALFPITDNKLYVLRPAEPCYDSLEEASESLESE